MGGASVTVELREHYPTTFARATAREDSDGCLVILRVDDGSIWCVYPRASWRRFNLDGGEWFVNEHVGEPVLVRRAS